MTDFKKILYCSTLCSEKKLKYLIETSSKKPLFSIQKFHRLLTEGIAASGIYITSLTSISITRANHSKTWWKYESEYNKGMKFIYLPFINLPYIRQIFISFFAFFYTLIWSLRSQKNKAVVVCDVLNVAVSLSSLIASKIIGVKSCAIVTDIPVMLGQARKEKRKSFMERLAIIMSTKFLNSYDSYVLLTKQMNDLVNIYNKPFMIMEGLVDITMDKYQNNLKNKSLDRVLVYTGSIYEKYGIKKLIEAFMQLEGHDIKLHIYGAGEMENDMPNYMKQDNRIVYMGVVPNQLVVAKQIEATLLINPRSSDFEFTKYSFPSKIMEYMVSGTPLVTTPLAGIPKEYYDYIYIFNDESVNGIYLKLKLLLSKPKEELHRFGNLSKQFVLKKKNNIIQAERLIELLRKT